MRTSILAARDETAQKRITAAAGTLADRFDLAECVTRLAAAQSRDAAVEAMQQREVIADLLEALITATEPKTRRKAKAAPETED